LVGNPDGKIYKRFYFVQCLNYLMTVCSSYSGVIIILNVNNYKLLFCAYSAIKRFYYCITCCKQIWRTYIYITGHCFQNFFVSKLGSASISAWLYWCIMFLFMQYTEVCLLFFGWLSRRAELALIKMNDPLFDILFEWMNLLFLLSYL
jgi:hypothetical protein